MASTISLPLPASAQSQAISGTVIDWSSGTVFKKTISGNTTFTFSNSLDGQIIVVKITAGSGNTVTWPTTKWAGGSAPTQTSGGTDIYTFINIDSVIYGSAIQAMA